MGRTSQCKNEMMVMSSWWKGRVDHEAEEERKKVDDASTPVGEELKLGFCGAKSVLICGGVGYGVV